MRTRMVRCKDGIKRQYIWITQTKTMHVWKCFDCRRTIYARKKAYAPKKAFLTELKMHTCQSKSLSGVKGGDAHV